MSNPPEGVLPEPSSNFKPLRTGSVRTQVLEAVRSSIFSGRLGPGDPLREAHLARDFGVSQATVREALIELEHLGLVVRKPNRETIVTRLTAQEVAERGELRAALEGMAGIQASERLTDRHFAQLEQKIKEMEAARAAGDYFQFSATDLAFHRLIWEFSGNKTLERTLEYLTVPLFAFLSIQRSRLFHQVSPAVRPHQPILDALRSGDHAAIRQAFEEHIKASYQRLSIW